MSRGMITPDPSVDIFLDRVKELDERRKLEDEIRRKKLREAVALKKKKLGQASTNQEKEEEEDVIPLVRPIPRTQLDGKKPKASHTAAGPELFKYKDTADVDKTIEKLIGRSRNVEKITRPQSTQRRLTEELQIPESSPSPSPPPLPTRRTYRSANESSSPPRLPARHSSVAKPEVPAKKANHFMNEKTSNTQGGGIYIPRPNAIAVMSATAAAKAPQLMRASADSSVGERAPTLEERAKFLGSSSSSSSSPNRKTTTGNLKIGTAIANAGGSNWMMSALNHGDIAKQEIPDTTAARKFKPLVPSKPNSLAHNKEAQGKEEQQRSTKITPRLKHVDVINRNSPEKQRRDNNFEIPELKRSTGTPVSEKENRQERDDAEAFARKNELKPIRSVRKTSYHEPEAVSKLGKLRNSSNDNGNIRKDEDKPEGIQRLNKLKPAVPIKKPDVEIPEALRKSLNNSNKAPELETDNTKTSKYFEKKNIDLLEKSMQNLKKRSTFSASDSPVRLPFTDPKAEIPKIIRPKTFDEVSSSLESNINTNTKLKHATKSRNKGPKRKLPKSLQQEARDTDHGSAADEPVRIVDYKVRTSTKAPPPEIKRPSRMVSNKLQQERIFSNSDLFI